MLTPVGTDLAFVLCVQIVCGLRTLQLKQTRVRVGVALRPLVRDVATCCEFQSVSCYHYLRCPTQGSCHCNVFESAFTSHCHIQCDWRCHFSPCILSPATAQNSSDLFEDIAVRCTMRRYSRFLTLHVYCKAKVSNPFSTVGDCARSGGNSHLLPASGILN